MTRRPDPMDRRSKVMARMRALVMADAEGYTGLSRRSGVSPSTIGNIGRGKPRWPRPDTTLKVLATFGYTLDVVPLSDDESA